MQSKRKLLNESSLYLILDRQVHSYHELYEIARSAVNAGIDIIQLRDKTGTAREIIQFAQKMTDILGGKSPFIINDRADITLITNASGVHLGQDDVPVKQARRILDRAAIIGKSCQTLQQAIEAQDEGADYIGFGSVFKTLTKPQRDPMDLRLLEQVVKTISVPVYAIGGISLDNIESLTSIGVRNFAICRGISTASDIGAAIRKYREIIDSESKVNC